MAKALCVLYNDPAAGYPPQYAKDDIPHISSYPDGQPVPNPRHIDFVPSALLGCVSGGLGLRTYLKNLGHTFVVTADKEGENSVFDRELPDADIIAGPTMASAAMGFRHLTVAGRGFNCQLCAMIDIL